MTTTQDLGGEATKVKLPEPETDSDTASEFDTEDDLEEIQRDLARTKFELGQSQKLRASQREYYRLMQRTVDDMRIVKQRAREGGPLTEQELEQIMKSFEPRIQFLSRQQTLDVNRERITVLETSLKLNEREIAKTKALDKLAKQLGRRRRG